MKESIVGFLVLFFCYSFSLTSATVLFKPISVSFPDLPAKFAVDVDHSGICGALQIADPLNGCSPLRNRFDFNRTGQVRFVLLVRGDCSFEEKIKNAQNSGYRAAIVYDDKDKANLVYMMVNPAGINVHAVFVSKQAGEVLKKYAGGEEGECCIYPPQNGKAWTVLAVSCLSLLVIVAFLVMVFFTPRNWWYWRRVRNRGPCHHQDKCVDSRIVEGLPRFAFSSSMHDLNHCRSGDTTCAICLEDYKDLEIIKVLPCQHDFHSSCVDSWLTKWGTFCPVCKLDLKAKFAKSEVKRGICALELAWRF